MLSLEFAFRRDLIIIHANQGLTMTVPVTRFNYMILYYVLWQLSDKLNFTRIFRYLSLLILIIWIIIAKALFYHSLLIQLIVYQPRLSAVPGVLTPGDKWHLVKHRSTVNDISSGGGSEEHGYKGSPIWWKGKRLESIVHIRPCTIGIAQIHLADWSYK